MNYTHYARRPRLALGEPERLSAEDTIITQARDILMSRMGAARGGYLSSPHAARDYLRLTLGTLEREEFWCIWLDAQHRAIAAECLFAGSLMQTSVYPREVVKAALHHNAHAENGAGAGRRPSARPFHRRPVGSDELRRTGPAMKHAPNPHRAT